MHRIGLLNNITDDYGKNLQPNRNFVIVYYSFDFDKMVWFSETDINFLMEMALERVAYLPFAYIVDQVGFFFLFLNKL
jgi:hypothetical protein